MKAAIYNYNTWVSGLQDSDIKPHFEKLLVSAGFTILQFVEHQFNPQGYTAIWLLSESHLAVHSFPEENKVYVELSSCNEEKNNQFISFVNTASL